MEHIEYEIDNEILNVFAPMDLDSILKPAEASEDVEPWDPYFNVERFSSLNNPHAWYKINKVRVNFVWTDEKNKKLYIFLLDKDGEKQAAEVPADLVEFYNTRDLIGKVFSLNHFQIAYTDPTEYPRYQNHSLSRCDWVILVNSKTELTEIPLTKHSEFPAHPWIASIRGLCIDKSTKKMLIDIIGRVTKGGLIHHSGGTACELFLRDVTGGNTIHHISHISRTIHETGNGFKRKGSYIRIPRIPLAPSEEDMFPFKLKRTQFPIRLSFAMTINKAQGQTILNVGVYLPDSVFSHGQLYVALSRGISRRTTKVLVKPVKEFRQAGIYTSNVVYQEVLREE